MRTLASLVLLLMMMSKASAQNYIPFPDSAAVWINAHYNLGGNPPVWVLTGYGKYCVNGADTIINATVYTQVHNCGAGYKGGIRDTAGKVMYVPANSQQEYLLYDFTLNTGDTALVYDETLSTYSQVIVEQVDSVLINGTYRKRIDIFQGSEWIVGIGNTQGLFQESSWNVSQYNLELYCMSHNDTTLYPSVQPNPCDITVGANELAKNASLVAFPNPTSGKITVAGIPVSTIEAVVLFNGLGQQVDLQLEAYGQLLEVDLKHQPGGIYTLVIYTPAGTIRQKIIRE